MNRFALLATIVAAFSVPVLSMCQPPRTKQSADPWWKHAVFYEIYPRSFQGYERGWSWRFEWDHSSLGVPAAPRC